MSEPTTARADVSPGVDADVAERLARRYPPPRVGRGVKIVMVVAATLVALGWLVWTALLHADPAVSGQVSSFSVESDTRMTVVLTVQRRDPQRPATCRVLAQSTDFQPVADKTVPVPASPYAVVNLTEELTTLRQATSVTVKSCASS